jgi:hypothetical protein
MCVCAAAIVSGCGLGSKAPTVVACEVLLWVDPITVTFPLDAGFGGLTEVVDVDGLLLIEFSYKNGWIKTNTIDISEGERDYVSSSDPFTPGRTINPSEVGEVISDEIRQHPTTRQRFRILCKSA